MRAFARDQRGVISVEFALTVPLLVTLVFAAVEFGAILYTQAAAEAATNNVVRQLATNRITQAQAKEAVTPLLPVWARANVDVAVTASNPTKPESNLYTVATTIPMSQATPTGFLKSIYAGRNISAAVTQQQEPTS
ncbi:TadE/TadG family type IV pilus assembly protein [Methylorubrum extorquens]